MTTTQPRKLARKTGPPAKKKSKRVTTTARKRISDEILTEADAAALCGWTEARLKMRRTRADKHRGDEDYVPKHVMLAKRPRYHRVEVLRWIAAHPEMFGDERMLELDEVAELLSVPIRSLRLWRTKTRKTPSLDLHPPWVTVGPKVYVQLPELEAWLQRRMQRAHAKPWEPEPPARKAAAKTAKRSKGESDLAASTAAPRTPPKRKAAKKRK